MLLSSFFFVHLHGQGRNVFAWRESNKGKTTTSEESKVAKILNKGESEIENSFWRHSDDTLGKAIFFSDVTLLGEAVYQFNLEIKLYPGPVDSNIL